MKYTDAHIHLSDPEYKQKTEQVIKDAKQAGVVALVSNSVNLETSKKSLQLAQDRKDFVYAALGIHPWNVSKLAPNELEQTIELIQNAVNAKAIVAVGEIGTDPQYAKNRQQKDQQAQVFQHTLKTAETLQLPAIIHSRWSAPKILETLPSYKLRGVLWHWFSTPTEILPKITARGDYVSEGPPTTFSDRTKEVIKLVPLENLLTETDGPVHYYDPAFKDRPTTPAFIPEVVKAIAEIKKVKEDEAAEQIHRNFTTLFGI